MTQHLIKLAVGIEDYDHLQNVQAARLKSEGILRHYTRNAPRRRDEVLNGGSLYWVIRGAICARQRLVDIEAGLRREDGSPLCALILDPALVRTHPVPFRPFQGWRYLDVKKAPEDMRGDPSGEDDLPQDMRRELRSLGLL